MVFLHIQRMYRNLTHLLICLIVSLTLVVSGGKAAVAQLAMAYEAASTTEVVICADGQAKTVLLNAAGEPVAPKSKECAKCPDCRPVIAIAMPRAVIAISDMQLLSAAMPDVPVPFNPLSVKGPQQPRAPPKGL